MLQRSFSTFQSSRREDFPPSRSGRGSGPLPQSPQGSSRDGGDPDAPSLFKQLYLYLARHKLLSLSKLPWFMSVRCPVPVCQATVGKAERANVFADGEDRKASSEAEAWEGMG